MTNFSLSVKSSSSTLLTSAAALLFSIGAWGQWPLVQDGSLDIANAYRNMSDAWVRHDPVAAVTSMADIVTFIDLQGRAKDMDRSQQLKAAREDMRETPGTRYLPRQTTVIQAETIGKDRTTVQETTIKELVTVDQNGTVASVRFVIASQDSWSKSPTGWGLRVYHVTAFSRFADASPSPALALTLRRLRSANQDLRSFDDGVNFSYCMHANQNQSIDYQTRRAYCGPDH